MPIRDYVSSTPTASSQMAGNAAKPVLSKVEGPCENHHITHWRITDNEGNVVEDKNVLE